MSAHLKNKSLPAVAPSPNQFSAAAGAEMAARAQATRDHPLRAQSLTPHVFSIPPPPARPDTWTYVTPESTSTHRNRRAETQVPLLNESASMRTYSAERSATDRVLKPVPSTEPRTNNMNYFDASAWFRANGGNRDDRAASANRVATDRLLKPVPSAAPKTNNKHFYDTWDRLEIEGGGERRAVPVESQLRAGAMGHVPRSALDPSLGLPDRVGLLPPSYHPGVRTEPWRKGGESSRF